MNEMPYEGAENNIVACLYELDVINGAQLMTITIKIKRSSVGRNHKCLVLYDCLLLCMVHTIHTRNTRTCAHAIVSHHFH